MDNQDDIKVLITKIINKIKKYSNIALFHHVNPDGDSISCSYGLALAIKKAFPKKNVVVVTNRDEILKSFEYLNLDKNMLVQNINESYLAIIGDSSVINRISASDQLLKAKEIICFDHHQNTTDFQTSLFWHEPNYPASALQAVQIARALLKDKLNEEIAFFLMIGILTDTGNFAYSSNNTFAPSTYSFLLQFISETKINDFFNSSRERTNRDLKIQKIILSKLKFSKHVVYFVASKKITKKFSQEEINRKINVIGNIRNYPIWVIFTHTKTPMGHSWKASLRSSSYSINKIANNHGGGGHPRASGATFKNKKEIFQIIDELNELVDKKK